MLPGRSHDTIDVLIGGYMSKDAAGGEWRGPESNWRHHDFQSCALPTELPRRGAQASVSEVKRSIVAVAAAVLVAASISGASEQPLAPIETRMPAPHFGTVRSGPFSLADVRKRARPLGPAAPGWARRLYRRSLRVLIALTDPRSGAMIAGERDGWDYVWPRDAAAGTIALEAAGLRPEARKAASFLSDIDTERAARFYSDGAPVPGRPAAGDAQGWVAAAVRTLCCSANKNSGQPVRMAGAPGLRRERNRRPARQRDRRRRPSRRDPEPLRDVARPGQGRGKRRAGFVGGLGRDPLPQPGSTRSR